MFGGFNVIPITWKHILEYIGLTTLTFEPIVIGIPVKLLTVNVGPTTPGHASIK